jgi:hypothetical protein
VLSVVKGALHTVTLLEEVVVSAVVPLSGTAIYRKQLTIGTNPRRSVVAFRGASLFWHISVRPMASEDPKPVAARHQGNNVRYRRRKQEVVALDHDFAERVFGFAVAGRRRALTSGGYS